MPKRPKKKRIPPTQSQLEKAIQLVCDEMGHLFSYWVWWTQARPILIEKFPEDSLQCKAMQNATVITSLLAARKLNEFFKARPSEDERNDDLRAYDYPGFKDTGHLIPPADYKIIHKRVAHMTYHPVTHGDVSYEMLEAVRLVFPRCVGFLEHAATALYSTRLDKLQAIETMMVGLSTIYLRWEEQAREPPSER
jgi:hypothetical protein